MANKLKVIRAERHLTQAQLAKLCSLSRATVNGIETGKAMPNLFTMVQLSKALKIPASEIFFDLDVV